MQWAMRDAQQQEPTAAADEGTPVASDTPAFLSGAVFQGPSAAQCDAMHRPSGGPAAATDVGDLGGYELLEELGQGGMGVVYRARQPGTDRIVALKVIRSARLLGLTDDQGHDALLRFQIEARAAARLDHEHVVRVYEVGECAGQPFYSMQFVEGASLAALLRGGPLAARRAAAYLEPVARAVHHAHQHGILHRDLKPHNILLETATDRPLVADFGLAKMLEGGSGATLAGQVFGSPPYMSPEQARDASQATVASDVYGVGATLYHMLTGRPPFGPGNVAEVLRQVLDQTPTPPRHLNPALDRDIATICQKCLEKEPLRRYESAAALADDLQRYLNHEPIRARPVRLPERVWRWCRRQPLVAGLAAALTVLIATALVLALVWQQRVEWDRSVETGRAQVQRLSDADIGQVPWIVEEIAKRREFTDPELHRLAADSGDRNRQVRAALALLPVDPQQRGVVLDRLLDCSFDEFPVLRDSLWSSRGEIVASLWKIFQDQGSQDAGFRAGMALATFDPQSSRWEQPAAAAFLAEQLLAANPDYHRQLRAFLRPVATRLVEPLSAASADPQQEESTRLAATRAVADFASGDAASLAALAAQATPQQLEVLLPALAQPALDRGRLLHSLEGLVRQVPESELPHERRVQLGRRRAGAALTMLRLGYRSEVAPLFQPAEDPEAQTQFVARVTAFRVAPAALLDCLEQAADERMRFGLLLALGEFSWDQLPADPREQLADRLRDWFSHDPSSAIHGAAGWLLKRWGFAQDVERVDQTPLPFDPGREWFVQRIGGECITFVVFPPGEFFMGVPSWEAGQNANPYHLSHRVKLTRRFALADREITRRQFERYLASQGVKLNDYIKLASALPRTDEHPMNLVTWLDAVDFCRWLTTEDEALGAEDQCDAEPPGLALRGDAERSSDWPFQTERAGYRLPTDAEWEYACRAGTVTSYGFGSDATLLDHYGMYQGNTPGSTGVARQFKPNPRGLFNMPGNLWEWCHDRWGPFDEQPAIDPVRPAGPAEGTQRVVRGGCFLYSPAYECRSDARSHAAPCPRIHRRSTPRCRPNRSRRLFRFPSGPCLAPRLKRETRQPWT